MEEVAPRMTRLRRRLSIEQNEDVISSPATPTKQRARKLLKPALEDISENAIAGSPKPAVRKSLVPEPTPATEAVTPGKLTRARANSSIQLEKIQGTESPKVMRATRRNSIAGTPTGTPTVLTPVRRSRRISKEYNKSPEAMVEIKVPAKRVRGGSTAAKEIIFEEDNDNEKVKLESSPDKKTSPSPSPDSHSSKASLKSLHVSAENSPGNTRRSPRLSLKINTSNRDQPSFENLSSNQNNSTDKCESTADNTNKSVLETSNKNLVSVSNIDEKSMDESEPKIDNEKSMDELEPKIDCKKSSGVILKSPITLNGEKVSSNGLLSAQHLHKDKVANYSDQNNIHVIRSTMLDKESNASRLINDNSSTVIFDDLDKLDESDLSNKENDDCNGKNNNDSIVSMEVDITAPNLDSSHSKNNSVASALKTKSFQKSTEAINIETVPTILTCNSTLIDVTSCESKSNKKNHSGSKNLSTVNTTLNEKQNNTKSSVNNQQYKNLSKENEFSLSDSMPAKDNTFKSEVFTSTPVQQNIHQQPRKDKSKFAKQKKIPESDCEESSSDDENINKKHTLLDSEALDAGSDYNSGDSQDESEREYAEENEIPLKGETLDSDEEESNDTDYDKDSFVVSSNEEDYELLSGSGDDLSFSDKELKMTKKSKAKYNEKKIKEQKRASKEMFEARHEKKDENSKAHESDDPDIIFVSKNKSGNRMRFNSSRDFSDAETNEQEISVMANLSKSDKDPLLADISIKKEIFEVSTNNKSVIEEIENVSVAENVTIITNFEERNPLESYVDENESTNSESSDDGGIADNYSALLNNLNESTSASNTLSLSKNKLKLIPKQYSLSLSEPKQKKNKNDSLLDKLNITLTGKENKTAQSLKEHADEKHFNDSKSSKKNYSLNNDMENHDKGKDKHFESSNNDAKSLTSEIKSELKNKECRKRNLSITECKAKKPKDDSIIAKLNLTSSGKEKKSKLDVSKGKQTATITETGKNGNDNFSSNDSNDAFDFKLMFMQDDDSDNDQKVMEHQEHIPQKKSELKTHLSPVKHKPKNDVSTLEDGKSRLIEVSQTTKKLESFEDKNNTKEKKHAKKKTAQNNEGEAEKDQVGEENSRKRKNKNNILENNNKVYLTSSENKIKVNKLPQSVIEKLENVPQIAPPNKTPTVQSVIATSSFEVKPIALRKSKPSHYLEESIHIDKSPVADSSAVKKLKNPKVLPSVPKAKTSADGFTSNFKITVLKKDKRHDAVAAITDGEFVNFKTQRLYGASIKRIATEELCRKQKKIKFGRF